MLWDIDLDFGNKLVTGPGTRTLLTAAVFKRDTADEIRVRFWSGGVQTELASGASGKFAVKPLGQYDAAPLVLADSWTKEGTGASTVYVFEPDFNGAALAALLNAGDDSGANDEGYVECMCEIRWVIDSKKRRTQTVNTTIYHDVIKDDDGSPTPDTNLWAAPLELTAEIPTAESIVVTGAGSATANGTYYQYRTTNGKPEYSKTRTGSYPAIYWSAGFWILDITGNAVADYKSTDAVATPDLVTTWTVTEGTLPVPTVTTGGTAATALGQACIVTHSDDTFSEWVAVTINPAQWLPRTAGIIWNEDTAKWQRLTLTSGTLDLQDLPDQ